MAVVLYGLMFVFAGLMVFATVKSKAGAGWGKPAAGASAGVVFLLVLVSIVYSLSGCEDTSVEAAVYDRAKQQQIYALQGFGKAIAKEAAGSKAMLVTFQTNDEARLTVAKEALVAGLGDSVEIVKVWNPLKTWSGDNEESTFDAAKLDEAFEGSGADLVITLLGMPHDFAQLEMLQDDDGPKMAVMNYSANTSLKQLIEHEYVTVAVVSNNGYKQAEELQDADTYFNARYVVVTPGNLNQNTGHFK